MRVLRYMPDGSVEELVPDTRTLAEARLEASERIKSMFEQEVAKGMPWRGKVLQIDDGSRANMSAAALRADRGTLPQPFAWRMADNSSLPLDAPGMIAMAEAAMNFYLALRQRMWSAIDATAVATTIAESDAIRMPPAP